MTTREVFEKVNNDNDFAAKVKAMKSAEDVYEAFKSVGLTDSFEVFKKSSTEINDSISKLSAAEVDAVAGGASDTITTLTTTTTASMAAAAAI